MNALLSSHRRLVLVFAFVLTVFFIFQHSRQSTTPITPIVNVGDFKPNTRPQDVPGSSAQKDQAQPRPNANPPASKPENAETSISSLPIHAPAAPINYMAGKIYRLKQLTWREKQDKIRKLIQWKPAKTKDHWPGFDDYKNKDYDPNRWEGFEWDIDYFAEVGVRDIQKDFGLKPEPYLPYPDYNTPTWKSQWKGSYAACEGPRGKNLDDSLEDMVQAYRAVPDDFPRSSVGSGSLLGLDEDVCFDRYNRFGAYGYGQSVNDAPSDWSKPQDPPVWSSIWWGQLQDACLERNKERYAPDARAPTSIMPDETLPTDHDVFKNPDGSSVASSASTKYHSRLNYHSRMALLIRTWEGYTYTENDLQAIRALIMELSLLSGSEYSVFLLVNVKDKEADIYNDPQVYQDVLKRVVPRELRDISLLWNEHMCESYYPDIGDWQVYWHQFMPLQWFSKTHPEFDFVWNWETDTRYTGNHYHFLEQVATFSRNMPRKNLWERSSRYYIPAAHGNYASFLADTDAAVAAAFDQRSVAPVWGPQMYNTSQAAVGPEPPTAYKDDAFTWGVGEEADLITLQPIWDPSRTEWTMRNKIWNFVEGMTPTFTKADPIDAKYDHPDFADVPRRAYINTVSRFSKKLLHAMHMENRASRTMQAEMWPATVALQHGLKAVYAPHPIWTDRKWPAWYLDAQLNADGGESAAWSQRSDSIYNHDREAAFRGFSWFYASWFPRILYRRWLGWAAVDIMGQVGGDRYEDSGIEHPDFGHIGGNGRMCVPGMLLHPVKKVKQNDDGDTPNLKPGNEDLENAERITAEVQKLLADR